MNTSIEKIRLVISYLFNCKSNREIAKTVSISRDTVAKIKTLLSLSELTYDEFIELSNSELEEKLKIDRSIQRTKKPQPNVHEICNELMQHKGLSKALLWEEYRLQTHGTGVAYTRFCELIKQVQKQNDISKKQNYFPAETMQIDYSGDLVDIDLQNGETLKASIFVGVLPFSGLIFTYATVKQRTEDWIKSCSQMFSKINGIPEVIVCDNAKALVTKNKNRIVEINPYFQEFLEFYKISVLPARPRKPQDKALCENAVNIVQKQILMRIRNEKFSNLETLNARLEYMTDCYNHKKTKTFTNSRMSIFIEQEKKSLHPLPLIRYKILEQYIRTVVPLDYHIHYLNNFYSVPYKYIRKTVELKISNNQICIFHDKKLIANHMLIEGVGKISTKKEHQTEKHKTKDYLSKESIISWSKSIGVNALDYCNFILHKDSNLYNNLNYLFNLRLWIIDKEFDDRVEEALSYAYKLKIENLSRLKAIIESKSYLNIENNESKKHKNLRGADYYKKVEKC